MKRRKKGGQITVFSFREFLDFHSFEVRETQSALGWLRKQVFDRNGERYELREAFDAYMRFGGMPGIADTGYGNPFLIFQCRTQHKAGNIDIAD